MVIDIHVHCYPDEVAKRSVSARAEAFRTAPSSDGTVGGIKESMSRAGVDLSVLHPIAFKPQQTVKMNRWSASVMDDKVISFGTIHPDYTEWKKEIKWLAAEGFKGIKFHGDCQGYYVDDFHMLKIYEKVFDAGLIALFHSGVDSAFEPPYYGTPSRLAKVLDKFPGADIIAAHMGGYHYWEEVEEHLIGKEIFLDTACSIPQMGLERVEKFIKDHGADKIIFGSDSPWRDQKKEIDVIKSLNLSSGEVEGILGNNAKKLLGL